MTHKKYSAVYPTKSATVMAHRSRAALFERPLFFRRPAGAATPAGPTGHEVKTIANAELHASYLLAHLNPLQKARIMGQLQAWSHLASFMGVKSQCFSAICPHPAASAHTKPVP